MHAACRQVPPAPPSIQVLFLRSDVLFDLSVALSMHPTQHGTAVSAGVHFDAHGHGHGSGIASTPCMHFGPCDCPMSLRAPGFSLQRCLIWFAMLLSRAATQSRSALQYFAPGAHNPHHTHFAPQLWTTINQPTAPKPKPKTRPSIHAIQ